MKDEALQVLEHQRNVSNQPTADALNETLSREFFAVFDVGNGTHELYT